jgi:Tfp pilus assembly protein PilN
MSEMSGRSKNVIGLFVDGLDLKLAHLAVKGRRVIVQELRTATLASKMAEHKSVDIGLPGADGGSDPFAVSSGGSVMESATADVQSDDNSSILLSLLAAYPSTKYSLVYSLAEPAIYYHVLETDYGLKGVKLRQRILEELRNIRAFQPMMDAVDHIHTEEGGLLCIVREDGLSLVHSLEGIKSYLGGRLPLIAGIDSSDVSLMNLVRQNYELQANEVTVIIYVGVEFTRLIFMRGDHFYQFAPILGEGYDSPNLQNTVYSRLLLEQDNLGLPRIHRIVLAGESHRIDFKEFLVQQLPDQEVDYLLVPMLDTSPLPPEQQAEISAFAVPIGAAWRILDQKSQSMYRVNLLPDSIRESQRVFKLAWHGYVLIVLLFISAFFFTWQITSKTRELRDLHDELTRKESQQAENQQLANSIDALQQQINRYKTSLALYDSLVPGSQRWSRTLTKLTNGVEDLNSLWVTDFNAGQGGSSTLNLIGYTTYRTRIPRFSAIFDNAVLKEVTVQSIRDQEVYKYSLDIPATEAVR